MKNVFSDYKQIIAAVVAGIFAIVAAYIRRDKTGEKAGAKTPVLRLLCFPFLYLILGVGMLAAEFFAMPMIEEQGRLNPSNPGEILALAGCIFVVAGVLWLPINITRLMFWPKPTDSPASVAVGQSAGLDNVSPPTTSSRAQPFKKAERPRKKL